MIVTIGNDHGGYKTKKLIEQWLLDQGHIVRDWGCDSEDSCDYPDYAKGVCELVADGGANFGILICGTGIGMSITANRNPKIRAGLCTNLDMARLTRQHNNANVLCLGARIIHSDYIEAIVETFLNTEFEGGRHQKRIEKL